MNKTSFICSGVWLLVVGCIMLSCFCIDAKDIDIKKYYQFNIIESAPDDYIIIVEWSSGDFNVQNLVLCKKVLYSNKLNQYLLLRVDKYNSVEFINNSNILCGPKITVIPIVELKDRVENNSYVNK